MPRFRAAYLALAFVATGVVYLTGDLVGALDGNGQDPAACPVLGTQLVRGLYVVAEADYIAGEIPVGRRFVVLPCDDSLPR